ncbi:dTDP-4-dehydrorhamnose reductase [uncultured Winogradskyella sp.]|jgi:dTDP-4-dehydrorhamnose reductase|uniref:dTDP-4-dehydrorhamnose reductase n=1 Tax=uncultured Winogradskyella sp. TaxID=395353 RepID=UPI0025E356F6|nr:dTDP-4-dehydrorhamnose reductase [uncultured Winogradskyella sp.]
MKSILVTGGEGQLALCIKDRISFYDDYKFIFKSSSELDITNESLVHTVIKSNSFDYCINCAAYTSVEKAEKEQKTAFEVNGNGPKYLAEACKLSGTILIHISTDYVFDGINKKKPYIETDIANPINVYGLSKLKGENEIKKSYKKHFILRTSWLYSEYGNNFLKTMLSLSKKKSEIEVINDQIGAPTYAGDLADLILKIIISSSKSYGLYHFSSSGTCSWFDFAVEIFNQTRASIIVDRISSADYLSNVKRPHYGVLDNTKAKSNFNINNKNWRDSLSSMINKLT